MRRSIFKIILLPALVFLAVASPRAERISDEQKAELFHFVDEDYLVETPTRHLTPVSKSDMNISVIEAEDLRNMNAHTLAEALNRITGVYVSFGNADFGSTSLLEIQGGLSRHTRVMVDGIELNALNAGSAETFGIPVGIISRIEVVKGVNSSTWGSGLGGTINIITKHWDTPYEKGHVRVSYGAGSHDGAAELSGKGDVDYYFFVGSRASDGLRETRSFKSVSTYAKFKYDVNPFTDIKLAMGFSQPESSLGDISILDISQNIESRTFWTSASFESLLASDLKLDLSIRHLAQKFDIVNNSLGLGLNGPRGELFQADLYDEKSVGASGKLVLERPEHSLLLGVDFDRGELDQEVSVGRAFIELGEASKSNYSSTINKWAIFTNDTISLGDKWTIIPGLRYDWNNRTGSFFSPSLGVVYAAGKDTIIRGSAGRGFTIPSISWTTGGALFLDPNPSLDVEEVWSFQTGVESRALKYVRVKASAYHHEIKDTIISELSDPEGGGFDRIMVNGGKIRRKGVELEAETAPWRDFSLYTGFSYVDIDSPDASGAEYYYTCNVAVRYDDRSSFRAELFGHYIDWDVDARLNPNYDFIWDLNIRKEIIKRKEVSMELFFTGHNIFNGSQYWSDEYKNPRRWGEVGLRFYF